MLAARGRCEAARGLARTRDATHDSSLENETDEQVRNEAFSGAFRDLVVDMLASGGITADTEYPLSRNLAWRYSWGTPPPNEYFPK